MDRKKYMADKVKVKEIYIPRESDDPAAYNSWMYANCLPCYFQGKVTPKNSLKPTLDEKKMMEVYELAKTTGVFECKHCKAKVKQSVGKGSRFILK